MVEYIFDTSAFRTLFKNYYESRFPTLWDNFASLIKAGKIESVREVANEINSYPEVDRLMVWAKSNSSIFSIPTLEEQRVVQQIFQVSHFNDLVSRKVILSGKPCADPFLIARAKTANCYLITQEEYKPNSAKIPNVCEHFQVNCTDLEGFMTLENWNF
ncbi:PIN domain-containing protein [Alicyclobacillus fodiniaquatilis]|uniref:PIN domain-containing protein n=1 Tax=Alicyclobacillus fodiniaquatilis TaxID=1661150 RepID=A0ABW4JEX8_9BACL